MAKIVSIHSYRGGTGKSNLTANLATAVALTGKRVGVVDTDIQSPGIHVLFGLDDKQVTRAVNDYLYDQCPIKDTAYHVSPPEVTAAGGRMYLIPASMKTADIARVLKEGYDIEKLTAGFAKSPPGTIILLENTRRHAIERVLWNAKPDDAPAAR